MNRKLCDKCVFECVATKMTFGAKLKLVLRFHYLL